MTLLDWFAATLPAPQWVDLAAEAGVVVRDFCGYPWSDNRSTAFPTSDEWWTALTPDERDRLLARVRYRKAAAMVAEKRRLEA